MACQDQQSIGSGGPPWNGVSLNHMGPMTLQTLVSVAMLAAFIWAVGCLLPKALREHDGLALTAAILTAILALFLWLWVGVGTRGSVAAQAVRGNHTSRERMAL